MPDINLLINATDKSAPAFKSAESNVDSLNSSAKKASAGFSVLGTATGTAIGTLASQAISSSISTLSGLASSVVTTGVQFDNMKQQAQIAFSTMLGDGGKAKSFLDDLQQFAASSPFEFPELVSAGQRLLAMGFAAKDVRPTLTAVGDAVAGLGGGGELVNRVTTAIGQLKAKGKATAEELLQLTEAGIPSWEFLAKKIGVDIPTAMDMVSKGAVSADTAISALVDGMNQKFGGLMEAQSHTFGGLLSTVQDTFAQLSGQVVTPFFDLMTNGLQSIVDWTGSPDFTAGITALTGEIEKAVYVAKTFFGDLSSGQTILDSVSHAFRILLPPEMYNTWQGFVTLWKNVQGALSSIMDAVGALIRPIADLVQQFVGWQDILLAVGTALAVTFGPAITAAIGAFVATFGPVIALFAGIAAASAALRTAWIEDWGGIQEKTQAAIDYITGVFDPLVGMIKTFSGDALGEIVAWVTGNQTQFFALGAIWETAKTTAYNLFNDIKGFVTDNLPSWIATLQQWGVAAWDWIVGAASTAVSKLGEWGTALIGWLGDNLPNFIKTFMEWQTALVNWIGGAIPKAINSLTDYIHGLREKGEGDGQSSLGKMAGGWATTLWEWITDDLIPAVGPAFMKFVSALSQYGQNLLTALGGLASELGQTLWEWIVDVTPTALRKLGEWGQRLWGWIQGNLPTWKNNLLQWGEMAWKWIQDATQPALLKLLEWGKGLWNWIKDQAPSWWEKLKVWAGMAWEWITKIAIPEALKKIAEWGGLLWGWITDNADDWADALLEWAGILWGWIIDVAWPNTRDKIIEWAGNLTTWITDNADDWWEQMKTVGEEWINSFRDGIEIAWINFTRWFFDTPIGSFIGDLLNVLNVKITPAYGIMESHGQQIAYSLNEGSRYNLDSLRQTGADMGDAISNGLTTNMDMHSPSRRMWGYGEDIVAGLAGSIHAGASILRSEAQYVADQIAEGFKASQGRIQAEVDSISHSLTTQMAMLKGAMLKGMEELMKTPAANGMVFLPGVTNLPKTGGDVITPSAPGATGTSLTPADITTLGEAIAAGMPKVTAPTSSVELLGGITLQATDLNAVKDAVGTNTAVAAKTIRDFISGFTDFLQDTLDSSSSVFGLDKYKQESALAQGTKAFQEYINGETHATIQSLKNVYTQIQSGMASILGVSASELDVTSADSTRLTDLIQGALTRTFGAGGQGVVVGPGNIQNSTTAGTNMDFISGLLQELVNFRSLANTVGRNPYYDSALPTDTRLTGGNTTNQYNITLQGSNNANADVTGLVQLLGALQAGATP